MGKQINYWLGYEEFLKIAQTALDCGCIIVKFNEGKLQYSQQLDIVTKEEYDYLFYVPEAGQVLGKTFPFEKQEIEGYTSWGNTVIQAGFSIKNDEKKKISRSRLFSISGYYDERGEYISRPECVTKVYNKLVRMVKKLAPYTELIDTYISTRDSDYLQEKEWKHKEYISPDVLLLREKYCYKLL